MVPMTVTGLHRRIKVMSINDEVDERLYVSPPSFYIIDIVLFLRRDIPEPAPEILFNGMEDELDDFVGIAGLNGLLGPGDDGTFIQPRRFKPGKRGAFSGPVQPYNGLKEPVVRKVLHLFAARPDLESSIERTLHLFFRLFRHPDEDVVHILFLKRQFRGRHDRPVPCIAVRWHHGHLEPVLFACSYFDAISKHFRREEDARSKTFVLLKLLLSDQSFLAWRSAMLRRSKA